MRNIRDQKAVEIALIENYKKPLQNRDKPFPHLTLAVFSTPILNDNFMFKASDQ